MSYLKKQGKVTKKWLKIRKQWFKENPAENYRCYICDRWLLPNETTLDHKLSRSRHPELRYVLSNLAPCCYTCNMNKGSKDA